MDVRKQQTFPFFRSIQAHMEERYIFNFRIKPEELAKKLPVAWLEPQVINGWSAVSFCILWLKNLTVVPIPSLFNFETISCAYRIGVMDMSERVPQPAVYVTDRWADLPMIARLAPWIIFDTVPVIKAALGHAGKMTEVEMNYLDGTLLFSAQANQATQFKSDVFASLDDFSKFIKMGVSSYAPSIYKDVFTKVDLHKEDVAYEPLEANIVYSELNNYWADTGMVLDSAVHAHGATYKWTYQGLYYK